MVRIAISTAQTFAACPARRASLVALLLVLVLPSLAGARVYDIVENDDLDFDF